MARVCDVSQSGLKPEARVVASNGRHWAAGGAEPSRYFRTVLETEAGLERPVVADVFV